MTFTAQPADSGLGKILQRPTIHACLHASEARIAIYSLCMIAIDSTFCVAAKVRNSTDMGMTASGP